MPDKQQPTPKIERAQRLRDQLRANLQKRKAQSKKRQKIHSSEQLDKKNEIE